MKRTINMTVEELEVEWTKLAAEVNKLTDRMNDIRNELKRRKKKGVDERATLLIQ